LRGGALRLARGRAEDLQLENHLAHLGLDLGSVLRGGRCGVCGALAYPSWQGTLGTIWKGKSARGDVAP
jgi:hypothetical protein